MNTLTELLQLSNDVKRARGLEFTPAEIARQPASWAETFVLLHKMSAEIAEFLRSAGIRGAAEDRPTVFLIGAGSSDFIGRSLTHLLRRHWQCDVIAVPSTDLLTDLCHFLLPNRRYVWISFSRSRESPEAVAVLENALREHPEIKHLVICCNKEGRLLKIGAGRPHVLCIPLAEASHDRGLAMTCSFSSMLVCGQCIAHVDTLNEYASALQQLIGAAEALLGTVPDIAAELASHAYRQAYFLGGGALRGVAAECALKVLELTAGKTNGMSESPLGLRHGPMAALDNDTLLVFFLSADDRRRRYEIDLLREINAKRLVKTRIVVHGSDFRGTDLADYIFHSGARLPIADYYRGPVDVIVGQLLALFLCMHWNLRADFPSVGNVINRVVQNVRIYQ